MLKITKTRIVSKLQVVQVVVIFSDDQHTKQKDRHVL